MATDQTTLRLGRADDGRLVSAEEFADADYDEPWGYERVDGRLVVMAPPGHGHQEASFPWENRLHVYCANHPEVVRYVLAQPWVRPDGSNDRIGDFGVYLAETCGGLEIPDRVPDIMFEVVSGATKDRHRDYVEKRVDYYRCGIREYIVIDRFRRTVTVFTLEADGYAERVLTVEGVYESPMLPGLLIPLSAVF
jgi:Uma2 family endonuclease